MSGWRTAPVYVLALLFAINLVNYIDRWILAALLPLIKEDMSLSDFQLGLLAPAFMIVYMCAAPIVAYLSDRGSRKNWIAYGVALWSAATFLSGLCRSYGQLFLARAAVGVGESGYGAVSPAFVAEHFPKERRGGVLAVFSMAIPVGAALGYVLGGWIGHNWGWRVAFMAVGIPGFGLASLAYFLRDPRDAAAEERAASPPPGISEYLTLYRIPSYVASTLSMSMLTFALGGLGYWMPTYFHRVWDMNLQDAGAWFGGLTVVAGLVGTMLGGWLGDRLLKITPKAYFLVSGAGLLLAVPCGFVAVMADSFRVSFGALFLTEMFAFFNMGPLNGVIVRVTRSSMRSMAFAANIFVIHALGDAASPAIIGKVSDHYGDLRPALLMAMLFLILAGLICVAGSAHVESDTKEVDRAEEGA